MSVGHGRTRARSSPLRGTAAAVVGLGLGCALLLAALPATRVELLLAVGDPALARVERGLRPTPAGEERLEWSRLAARAIAPRPSIARDLAVLHFARGARLAREGDGRAAREFERAEALFAESLARDPARPEAWYGLAALRLTRSGDAAGAAAALRMSYRMAPLRPSLADFRAPLGLLVLDRLDPGSRHLLHRELRLLARDDGERLRAWARLAGVEEELRLLLSSTGAPRSAPIPHRPAPDRS